MIGICHVPVAVVRSKPSHKSLMTNQLLAGEHVEILEVEQTWLLIMSIYDGSKGWVDSGMIDILLEGEDQTIKRSFAGMVKAPLLCAKDQYGRTFYLPGGSCLYKRGSSIAVAPCRNLESEVAKHLIDPIFSSRKKLVNTALAYNGAPSLLGGKTIFGIDCSGLLQVVYKLNGMKLPRTIDQQIEKGNPVNFDSEKQPGDLAFFESPERKLIHAGIILNKERIIHSFGEVRVDMLDREGIFNKNTRKYTHKLRVIKNVID